MAEGGRSLNDNIKAAKDAAKIASGDPITIMKYIPKIASCGCLVFTFLFSLLLFFFFWSGTPGTPDAAATTNTGLAAACGQKIAIQSPPLVESNCSLASKVPSSNGFYNATTFGCSQGHSDSGDACDGGGCPFVSSILKTTGLTVLDRSSGVAYENGVEYFSANRMQFGCDARLKVTNPTTGQAVIVKPVDAGPGCSVQGGHQTIDLSYAAKKAIGEPDVVKVDIVDKATAIGPVSACTSAFSGTNKLSEITSNLLTKLGLDKQKQLALGLNINKASSCL